MEGRELVFVDHPLVRGCCDGVGSRIGRGAGREGGWGRKEHRKEGKREDG